MRSRVEHLLDAPVPGVHRPRACCPQGRWRARDPAICLLYACDAVDDQGEERRALAGVRAVEDAVRARPRVVAIIESEITWHASAPPGLREGPELYARLLAAVEDGFLLVDSTRRVVASNPAARRILRIDGRELTCVEDVLARWHPYLEDGTPLTPANGPVSAALESGLGQGPVLIALRSHDGEVTWLDLRVVPLHAADGGLSAAACWFSDVTARRQRTAALDRASADLAQRVRELERRSHDIQMLAEMTGLLQSCQSAGEAFSVISPFVQQIFPVSSGMIAVEAASGILETVCSWDITEPPSSFEVDSCWGLRRGRRHLVQDTSQGLLCKHLADPPPAAYVCTPMLAHGETIGLLHITDDTPGAFSITRETLASAVAENLALAVANLRLRESLRVQAIVDAETGLYSARYMEDALEHELQRARRTGRSAGLILLDLAPGHDGPVDAAVLSDIASSVVQSVRSYDYVGRFSRADLAVVVSDVAEGDLRRLAAHLAEGAEAALMRAYAGAGPSVSAGCASWSGGEQSPDDLVQTARLDANSRRAA